MIINFLIVSKLMSARNYLLCDNFKFQSPKRSNFVSMVFKIYFFRRSLWNDWQNKSGRSRSTWREDTTVGVLVWQNYYQTKALDPKTKVNAQIPSSFFCDMNCYPVHLMAFHTTRFWLWFLLQEGYNWCQWDRTEISNPFLKCFVPSRLEWDSALEKNCKRKK